MTAAPAPAAIPAATIEHAEVDGTCYLKLCGELRHDNAAPLDALIERLFASTPAAVQAVVIDLTGARFLDSTMIGLLAGIARELRARDLAAPTVFSTDPEIDQLLHSLCLDQVFTIVPHATDRALDAGQLCALDAVDGGRCAATMILKAHAALIELNEANREAFQPVVDLFREQLAAEEGVPCYMNPRE